MIGATAATQSDGGKPCRAARVGTRVGCPAPVRVRSVDAVVFALFVAMAFAITDLHILGRILPRFHLTSEPLR